MTKQDRWLARHLPHEFINHNGIPRERIKSVVARIWSDHDEHAINRLVNSLCPIFKDLVGPGGKVSEYHRARSVDIDFQRAATSLETYGLKGQLQQVFINLSLNALDAMPTGGRLMIRSEAKRGNISVQVRDTGGGITPETGRKVFEPFFTTKEPGHGTGLGLAVSYGIIQKHGGTIDFSSTPGEGTVFTVQIPILVNAPET